MDNSLSLYIHIPFCARKCLYCDFLSFSAEDSLISAYFDGLIKEIERTSQLHSSKTVRSVFFGGGTPSLPDAKYIVRVMDSVRSHYSLSDDPEVTIEANPGTVSFFKLIQYREAGINRLSIGAQSFDDGELKRLGRIHDTRAFYETYESAEKAGFTNINIDIMSALPGQSITSYMNTLTRVAELKPAHISAYSLIIEEGTPFYDMDLNLPSEDEDREMYHTTKNFLQEKGYHRYEISNYAFGDGEGYECYHNKVYWQRGDYQGVGLGAASLVDNSRFNNLKDIRKYLSLTSEKDFDPAVLREDFHRLSVSEQMEEYMFLGLRLVRGVDTRLFRELFGKDISEVYGDIIEKYRKLGLLQINGDRLALTEKGLDVSNTVMADFLL